MTMHFLKKTFLASLCLTFLCSTILSAQSLTSKLPTDPAVTIGTLSNGLKYYIRPNDKPEGKVELRLVVNAGSILEDEDQQGLAHFMEHMNFNGTKNYPKNELVNFLQSIGVEFGADLNAYTSFDETVYILPIPTDRPDNLEKGFQVIEDWAHQALMTEKDIDEERGIVLEESRMGKGADDRMLHKFIGPYTNGSHYANRLPIGKDDILKNFKYETVRRFYKDWYRPNLMSVIVVGDITKERAEELIKKHFAGLTNPKNARDRKAYSIAPYTSQKAMVVTDKEASSYNFSINYASQKEADQKLVGDYRNEIVRSLFISLLNKRFDDLRQSAQPPFTYAYAYIGGFARGYENFAMTAIPSTSIETAINASIAELIKAQEYGFTNSEMELEKKKMLNSMEKSYNERNKTKSSTYAAEYIRAFLTNEPIPGMENEYSYYKEYLPKVSLEEVNQVAKKWLSNNKNYFTLLTGNGKDLKVPTDMELLNDVKSAFKQKVQLNEEKVVSDQLLAKEPVAGTIVSESTDKDLDATTYTLSNGLKVTIKKTDFKSDEILMNGLKKGGSGNYPAQDKQNVQLGISGALGASLVESMGYGTFTPTALKDFLAGKTVNVSTTMSGISNSVRGNSSIKDLETLFQLNYLKLTEPRKDEALAQGVIATQKAQLGFLANNPQVGFVDSMMSVFYHNDPLTPIAIPKASDFDKVNLDRVIEIYKNEFADATGFEFFFVGNIDEKTIKPLIEKYIASLPVKAGSTPNFKDNGLRPIKGNQVFKYYKGADPKSLILNQYYGEIPYSEDLVMKADFLSEILNIKIIENLREEMGAIYGGGIYASVDKNPYNNYSMTMQLPCGPENVDTILAAADIQINNIKTKGPEAVDLEKVKAAKYEKHKNALKENNYWLGKLVSIQFWNADKQRFLDFNKVVENISAKDIQETANSLFDGKNSFKAIMYPAE